MTARPNRKPNTKRRKKKGDLSRLKMPAISVLLGAVAAVGFWRCLDDGSPDPFETISEKGAASDIATENGQMIDPTLVNEKMLLNEEIPEKEKGGFELRQAEEGKDTSAGDVDPLPAEQGNPAEDADATAERFPLYAAAYHFHTQVKAKPSIDSAVVGYARRGAAFRVSRQVSRKGCARGWYEIAPGNLFVCAGEGVLVGEEPVTFSPSPSAPNLEASLPYAYAYVNVDNIPQYWRIPTLEEKKGVEDLFERLDAQEKTAPVEEESAREVDGGAVKEGRPEATGLRVPDPRFDEGEDSDPFGLPQLVHQRMNKGYFVSVDGEEEGPDEKYARTIRGRYIPANRLNPAAPSTFEGLLLGEASLPRVFVVGGGVKLLKQKKKGGVLEPGLALARLMNLPFLGDLKRGAKTYFQVSENQYLSSQAAVLARKTDPPADLKPGERWIDVDLSEQTLVAYEGDMPVFATLVSTGREGFETPQGSFRIYSKHISITMDDTEAGDEAYSIEDVPWTQYFEEGWALHAAFWHNRYGRARSHGCVNLSPGDARRLFFWTEPHLPAGLHGVIATRSDPGTRVVVHE